VQLIPVTASYGTDIPSQTYTITFAAGSTYAYDYLTIPTFDDSIYEGTEEFIVRLQFVGMYSSSAVYDIPLQLFDNESPPNWTTQVDYYYDDENRLIARQEQHSTQPQLDSTQAFYYDRGQVVLETKDGTLADRLVWGPNVDQLLADEQLDWTNPQQPELEVLWPLGDHLNSNRDLAVYDSVTDITVIGNHIIYDSFGNLISQTDSTFTTDYRWTGRWFDITTGLQNNHHRWYDPRIGQWMSEDPHPDGPFAAGDANVRRYVANRATTSIDPSGLIGGLGIGGPIWPGTPGYRLPGDMSPPPNTTAYRIPHFESEWLKCWCRHRLLLGCLQ
jgi:RHS repeat-associated protein